VNSPYIQKLVNRFAKFPNIGSRVAARFVFYLIRLPKEEIEELTKLISEIKDNVKLCEFCFNVYEVSKDSSKQPQKELCDICANQRRDKTLLCIVEKESDLASLEKTKKYKGVYFILGGTISLLKKQSSQQTRIKQLEERIKNPEKFGLKGADFKEIIIATNSTTEGEATALYLERTLKHLNKKITRLGRGLPAGGELEYADEKTLESALEGRK